MYKWLEVDSDSCIACGMCTAICPDIFDEDLLGYAFVKDNYTLTFPLTSKQKEIIKECPVHAIKIKSKSL